MHARPHRNAASADPRIAALLTTIGGDDRITVPLGLPRNTSDRQGVSGGRTFLAGAAGLHHGLQGG